MNRLPPHVIEEMEKENAYWRSVAKTVKCPGCAACVHETGGVVSVCLWHEAHPYED